MLDYVKSLKNSRCMTLNESYPLSLQYLFSNRKLRLDDTSEVSFLLQEDKIAEN